MYTSGKCVCLCVRACVCLGEESLKGFIKEWKVCSHLCRKAAAALALTCSTASAQFQLDSDPVG